MDRPADTALRTAGRAGRGRAGALDAPTPHRSGRVAPARTDVPGPDGPDPGGPFPGSVAATKPDLTAAVAAAQHGDEQAFRILYRDVQPRLLRYLRAMVGDDAEDVASEAWLQIARDLADFSGDSDGFRGWAAPPPPPAAGRRVHRRSG